MRHLVSLLVLSTCVAAAAEAATVPAAKTSTNTKATSASNAAQTSPRTTAKSRRMAAPNNASESGGGMDLGLRAIGGSLGFVNAENMDAALTLGVFADWGRIAPKIALEPRLDYWTKSQDVSGGATASVRDVSLGMRGKYMFESSNPKIQPFAGAGLSVHFLHGEATVPGFPTTESSTTKLGLDFGGGLSSPIGPRSSFVGEGWYGVVSGSNRFSMRAGISYRLH